MNAKSLLFASLFYFYACHPKQAPQQAAVYPDLSDSNIIRLADPTIFFHKGTYYLYGTGGNVGKGFLVYTSTDAVSWQGPRGADSGYALTEGNAFGTSGFWAPQVFYHNRKFYMAYTANEQIAIAASNHPLGPFRQDTIRKIQGDSRQIDPFVFIDTDGRIYLYHVRLQQGNRIFAAELKSDLSDIIPGTARECVSASAPWENTANATWPVAEGPTVLKRKGWYYLFYSANDFRNIDYAVGYATSTHPMGPWTKHAGNPIISRKQQGLNGTGHGDIFNYRGNRFQYVLHTHGSSSRVQPRLPAVVAGNFRSQRNRPDSVVIQPSSLRYLKK